MRASICRRRCFDHVGLGRFNRIALADGLYAQPRRIRDIVDFVKQNIGLNVPRARVLQRKRFIRKQKAKFPRLEDMIQVTAVFNPNSKAETQQSIGKKLVSQDNTKSIIMLPRQFAVSQLAPYIDWPDLYETAHEKWEVLRTIMKLTQVSQVSTRFINRIDIPTERDGRVDIHRYFNVGLSLPPYAEALHLQHFQITSTLNHADGLKFQLQVLSAPSQLIDFLSFVIDIDLSTTDGVPPSEDKLWELIGSLRQYKNDLFESCITPETRKLFQ